MKERPILFKPEMVQAIMSGTKTQTRRIVKPQPPKWANSETERVGPWLHFIGNHPKGKCGEDNCGCIEGGSSGKGMWTAKCPYGQIGDILWVRETFRVYTIGGGFEYKADGGLSTDDDSKMKWKPSIHMPKEACRLFLKIKDIRVERLKDISNNDAIAEGMDHEWESVGKNVEMKPDPTAEFALLWIEINGEDSWNDNPWVWVVEFEKIEKP